MDIPKVIEEMAWAFEEALRSDCWDMEVVSFEGGDETYLAVYASIALLKEGASASSGSRVFVKFRQNVCCCALTE